MKSKIIAKLIVFSKIIYGSMLILLMVKSMMLPNYQLPKFKSIFWNKFLKAFLSNKLILKGSLK